MGTSFLKKQNSGPVIPFSLYSVPFYICRRIRSIECRITPMDPVYEFEWPSDALIQEVKGDVSLIANVNKEDVRTVVTPYRVCPLGAHIDHQGGPVTAMTVDKGVILGFVSSGDNRIILKSRQFTGDVRFRIDNDLNGCHDAEPCEEGQWGNYARGAVYALKKRGYNTQQGIIGIIDGLTGLHGSGISSSAAVGISFLLALEYVNGLDISASENIELDRIIENDYLGLKNGILDQSAILLSKKGCLTVIHCKNQSYQFIYPKDTPEEKWEDYKLLLAFSGLQQALASSSSYNSRVTDCKEAARILLEATGRKSKQPVLSDVTPDEYEQHKAKLDGGLARRAKHFFTECARVSEGIEAWARGDFLEFGRLMSESGRSSIENYECGCKEMVELLRIVQNAPGVVGARFSGAGFRGCCVALVATNMAEAAAAYIHQAYLKAQPDAAKRLQAGFPVLICSTGGHACVR